MKVCPAQVVVNVFVLVEVNCPRFICAPTLLDLGETVLLDEDFALDEADEVPVQTGVLHVVVYDFVE